MRITVYHYGQGGLLVTDEFVTGFAEEKRQVTCSARFSISGRYLTPAGRVADSRGNESR